MGQRQRFAEVHGSAAERPCESPPRDGFVDRYFNRHASRLLTTALLRTPLTPNGITLLGLAVGLTSAGAFAVGGYAAGIAGALLFQLSVIIDCCDGEVARARGLQSDFGDRLDLLADNVVHTAVVLAIGWGRYRDDGRAIFVLLGVLGAAGTLGASILVRGMRRPDDAEQPPDRLQQLIKLADNRDFSAVVLLFAVIGRLDLFLWPCAVVPTVLCLFLGVARRSTRAPASSC